MHKITLTGRPVSGLKNSKDGKFLRFNMEESGSPSGPKGLPKSSTILFTVFVTPKQLKKADITKENFMKCKLVVQGEPTLDVPFEDCPGEIGVVCFQIQITQPKEIIWSPENPQITEKDLKIEEKLVISEKYRN